MVGNVCRITASCGKLEICLVCVSLRFGWMAGRPDTYYTQNPFATIKHEPRQLFCVRWVAVADFIFPHTIYRLYGRYTLVRTIKISLTLFVAIWPDSTATCCGPSPGWVQNMKHFRSENENCCFPHFYHFISSLWFTRCMIMRPSAVILPQRQLKIAPFSSEIIHGAMVICSRVCMQFYCNMRMWKSVNFHRVCVSRVFCLHFTATYSFIMGLLFRAVLFRNASHFPLSLLLHIMRYALKIPTNFLPLDFHPPHNDCYYFVLFIFTRGTRLVVHVRRIYCRLHTQTGKTIESFTWF